MTATELVAAERQRALRSGAGATLAWCGALLAAGLAAAALGLGGGRWIDAPRWLPLAVAVLLSAAAAAIAARGMRSTQRVAATEHVAEQVESARGLRDGSLRAALQLAGSGPLAAAGMAALDSRLQVRLPASAVGRAAPPRRSAFAPPAVALLLALGALAAAAPSHRDGVAAVLRPIRAWRGDLLPPLALGDVPPAVRRGTVFAATVVAEGRRQVTLRERQTGSAWSERTISLDGQGRSAVHIGPVNGNLALVLSDGRSESPELRVAAVDRAYLGAPSIVVTAPQYLGGAIEHVAAAVPVHAQRGATVAIDVQGTVPLAAVALLSPRDTLTFISSGQRARGRFRALADARWEWRALSAGGDTLEVPPALDVTVIADSAPSIAISAPMIDTIVSTSAEVSLRLIASDDHGLALVRLDVVPNGGRAMTREVARSLPSRWGADVAIDVASLGIHAGEAARVSASAVDNSPWRQTATSRAVVIRIPGASEQRERTRAAADSLVASATAAAADERDLARRSGEASRDRGTRTAASKPTDGSRAAGDAATRPRDTMSFATEQRAREVRDEQRKLSSNVADLRQRAGELQQQLARAGALDSSLAAQLRDAQKLMQEAMTPELAASLAALDTALQSRSGDGARASLADLARQQEKLRQQLDRVAEMLSRAAIEGSLKTLHDEAREVAAAASQRADSLATGQSPRSAAALEDRARKVGRDAATLAQRLRKKGGEASAAQAGDASAHANASAAALDGAANPKHGNSAASAPPRDASSIPNGAAAARTAAAEMQKAADALAGARSQQIGAWKSELAGELDQSIQEMMQLGQGERALEERSKRGASGESLRAEQSALQQGVERTSERLEKASRASSLLSSRARGAVAEARRQSTRATAETARPQGGGAHGAQDAFGNAADALTRAAAALVRDRERVNSSESATGFGDMLKEMQQLAKRQGALNGQAAGLFQMPGGAGSGGEQARAVARQQRALARALDELGDADGSGRADALAAEARHVADALERGETSAATKERQEQLLRRMLDAGRSLEGEERDEGKREATSANGVALFTPDATDARGAAARRWHEPTWDELRGLSADERRAVIDYFRRLNASVGP